ncbi:MAG: YceI family protein [Flavobacteriales bacterium]|nr:YceI family protein [Flavobacteriales bacterium]MCX7650578.1 YceI family protein [Flavobacteriales bacterium]MDW8431530.1 YceI family protein [Flavobacteriales bacterium]
MHTVQYVLLSLFVGTFQGVFAQKYMTRTGVIRFFSEAPLENIEAINRQVLAVYDAGSREMAFRVLIKGFEFEKAAMQDHFNRDYLHSDRFPQATFEGRIVEPENLSAGAGGPQKVKVTGQLTIHGVTKAVTENGTISFENGRVILASEFVIRLSDFNIKVPSDKVRNISNTIKIFVNATLDP